MIIDKNTLQLIVDNCGNYLIGKRKISDGRGGYDFDAVFFSPNLPVNWTGKVQVGELKYDEVIKFAETDIRSVLHLGSEYGPFQYGIYYKDIVDVAVCTVKSMDLIVHCYNNDIKEYYEVLKAMKHLPQNN